MRVAAPKLFVPVMHRPYIFRGVMWDDHWEYDAPCVLYGPVKRYGIGGNTGHLASMIEEMCELITLVEELPVEFSDHDLKEFKWRGWSPRNFARRTGWHIRCTVAFHREKYGLNFRMGKMRETFKGKH